MYGIIFAPIILQEAILGRNCLTKLELIFALWVWRGSLLALQNYQINLQINNYNRIFFKFLNKIFWVITHF